MKAIKNPSERKIGVSLIPIFLVLIYVIITKSFPVWALIVGAGSLVIYMSLLTYYCIKQKCYQQLIRMDILLLLLLAIFIVVFRLLN